MVTSYWAWLRLKSPASPLFIQPFIRAQIKENIKAPRHWPLCGEFTGDFPAQIASSAENFSIWWRHHGHMEVILNRQKTHNLVLMWHGITSEEPTLQQAECTLTNRLLILGIKQKLRYLDPCVDEHNRVIYYMSSNNKQPIRAYRQIYFIDYRPLT